MIASSATRSAVLFLGLLPSASEARTIYPETMADFSFAQRDCQSGDLVACKRRDRDWAVLRKGGFNFVIDKSRPDGFDWR